MHQTRGHREPERMTTGMTVRLHELAEKSLPLLILPGAKSTLTDKKGC
jgi:hypothetical protein